MTYLTDTHAIHWHLSTRDKLSAAARAAFDSVERGENQMRIPSITLV